MHQTLTIVDGTIRLHGIDTGLPVSFRAEQVLTDQDERDLMVRRAEETGRNEYWRAAESLGQRIADAIDAMTHDIADSSVRAAITQAGAKRFLADLADA